MEGPTKKKLEAAGPIGKIIGHTKRAAIGTLRKRGIILLREHPYNAHHRENGIDWPLVGFTMTGRKRLDALHSLVDRVISDNIPGDFIETGVWRGGSAILMKAILQHRGITDRNVWCADTFSGMPVPSDVDQTIGKRTDTEVDFSDRSFMAVTLQQVQANFAKFNLLDENVRFLKGLFRDTLRGAPISALSILRLDGDLYESTWDALSALYFKVSPGGYIIVDDYGAWPGCKTATDKFLSDNHLEPNIERIDGTAIYWRV